MHITFYKLINVSWNQFMLYSNYLKVHILFKRRQLNFRQYDKEYAEKKSPKMEDNL